MIEDAGRSQACDGHSASFGRRLGKRGSLHPWPQLSRFHDLSRSARKIAAVKAGNRKPLLRNHNAPEESRGVTRVYRTCPIGLAAVAEEPDHTGGQLRIREQASYRALRRSAQRFGSMHHARTHHYARRRIVLGVRDDASAARHPRGRMSRWSRLRPAMKQCSS